MVKQCYVLHCINRIHMLSVTYEQETRAEIQTVMYIPVWYIIIYFKHRHNGFET